MKFKRHHKILGELVIEWSAKAPADRPQTGHEMFDAIRDKRDELGIEDAMHQIVDLELEAVIQYEDLPKTNPLHVCVVVPHKDDAEQKLPTDGAYKLPDFYAECAFKKTPVYPTLGNDDEFETFRRMRIGDYSIAKCF